MATSVPVANAPNGAFGMPPVPGVAIRLTDLGNLSLANGMTAGFGDNDGNTSNPPLLGGQGAAVNPYGGDPNWPIQRVGVMRNAQNALPGNVINSLYFIFNPTQIGVSFSANASQIPPSYLFGSQPSDILGGITAGQSGTTNTSSVAPNLTQGQTVSWSLFFDRTYDMMYGGDGLDPDDNRGVLKDTAALYNLMGAFEGESGVPLSTLIQVVFGQTKSGQLWGFTGYIVGAQITYGIFRHNMIPSRCEVDVTMMATYIAPQTANSPTAAFNAAAASNAAASPFPGALGLPSVGTAAPGSGAAAGAVAGAT